MEWTNIHRSTLQSDVMLEVEPADGWTWVLLQSYCMAQENSGRIKDASKWTDRAWMRSVMVERSAVQKECPLWHWDGNDLLIEFYPLDAETAVKKKRRGGAKGAAQRWHPRVGKPIGVPLGKPIGEPKAETVGETMGEVMRKDQKGSERIRKDQEEARAGEGDLGVEIPSLEEVRTWAMGPAGVDPAYAEKKWRDANEKHAWVSNGRLVDWKSRWKRFWEEDREGWFARRRNSALPTGEKNKKRAESDAAWWWEEPVEVLSKALTGALLGSDPTAERLREILEIRQG
jgi:hypothetical protein